MDKLNCFKAYDIRAKLGVDLNNDVAYKIGRAFGVFLMQGTVVIGSDARLTSDSLKNSLSEGLRDSGISVIDLGLSGTEEVYFATSFLKADGGIEVTASHNPIDYNGMKIVLKDSKPIDKHSGLNLIQEIAETNLFPPIVPELRGKYSKVDLLSEYINKIFSFVDLNKLDKKLKVVINSGNGAAGKVVDAIDNLFKTRNIPIELIKVHNSPDGTFPNGIPNPLLPECREDTVSNIKKYEADLGIAFDGDFDRCFFFDENARFIDGYYIVGLLAKNFLDKKPFSRIIHDPRLTWNTKDIVVKNSGVPVQSKTGHAFIKNSMRIHDAVYGGEMSAHHYFRDFYYCDSGMIPWLIILESLCVNNSKLSSLVDEMMENYPVSGEVNVSLSDPELAMSKVLSVYSSSSIVVDSLDGFSFEFPEWRFNIRSSNTEPLVRLNVESRGDFNLVLEKTSEILFLINGI